MFFFLFWTSAPLLPELMLMMDVFSNLHARLYEGSERVDECCIYKGKVKPKSNGYTYIKFKMPDNSYKTSSIQRWALVVFKGKFELGSHLDASHLCHNKQCINPQHLNLEERLVNNGRRVCIKQGECTGHPRPDGLGFYPDCLLNMVCFFLPLLDIEVSECSS